MIATGRTLLWIAAALLTACGQSDAAPTASSSPASCETFGFQEADEWDTRIARIDTALRVAWASNAGFRDDPGNTDFPDETVRHLPSEGIVITAVEPRPYTGGVQFKSLDPPVRLADGYFLDEQYEGQPAPDVSTYVIDGWIKDDLLNVMVRMGRTNPTDNMQALANQELRRLCLP